MVCDVAIKLRQIFLHELTIVAETGKVPLPLFGFLSHWRATLHAETQLVEGIYERLHPKE